MINLQKIAKSYLIYLLVLAAVVTGSAGLILTKKTEPKKVLGSVNEQKTFSPIPLLSEGSTFPLVSAEAVLAVDLDSGVILYQKDPDKTLLPASTTKMMTALVAMEYFSIDQEIRVASFNVEGQKMGLTSGEVISVKSLLYGLLIYSANDAAEALARAYPGGRELFVAAMNLKARELHLDNTHFTNPTGLDGEGLTSTARDLIRLAMVAMQNSLFAEIVGTKTITITSVDGRKVYKLGNINKLLGTVDGNLGIKTGWTEEARENLISEVIRNNHKVVIAVLGSQDRFGESKELIEWIFGSYQWTDVVYKAN